MLSGRYKASPQALLANGSRVTKRPTTTRYQRSEEPEINVERLRDRASRIKRKLELEFPGHTCRALGGTAIDPSVHRFALNDEHGIARYLLTVLEATLTDAGIPEPEALMEEQGTVERMREAGMDRTRLLHPLLEKRLVTSR